MAQLRSIKIIQMLEFHAANSSYSHLTDICRFDIVDQRDGRVLMLSAMRVCCFRLGIRGSWIGI